MSNTHRPLYTMNSSGRVDVWRIRFDSGKPTEIHELMHDAHTVCERLKFESCNPLAMHQFGMIPTGSCVGGFLPCWFKRRRHKLYKRIRWKIGRVFSIHRESVDLSKCLCAHKRRAKTYTKRRTTCPTK